MRYTKITLAALSSVALLVGCGQRGDEAQVSQPAERYDMPADKIPVDDARAFIAHARTIATSPDGRGTMTVGQVLSLMPMAASQKQIIANAYPNDLAVECDAGRCTVSGSGRPVEATLDASVGPIRNPLLGLKASVSMDYVLRGDQSIETCDTVGLYVKKFIVRKDIQGMHLDVTRSPGAGKVNLGDDDQNYTCE